MKVPLSLSSYFLVTCWNGKKEKSTKEKNEEKKKMETIKEKRKMGE